MRLPWAKAKVGPKPVAPTREIGRQRQFVWPEWLGDDPVAELRWPRCVPIYDKMRVESQLSSVLAAVVLPIQSTRWFLDQDGADAEVMALVSEDIGLDDVGPTGGGGRFSFLEHLRLALTMVPFGHSFFEQVYFYDANGRARLRKLGWRPPRSIQRIDVGADGGLTSIQQFGCDPIPVNRLVAYVRDREGAAWEGRSILRAAYGPWKMKQELVKAQAVGAVRIATGVPIYEASPPVEMDDPEEAKAASDAEIEFGEDLISDLRAGERSGSAIPHDADVRWIGVDGAVPDLEKIIRYYDEQMSRVALQHFLGLGSETGSWALGDSFKQFYMMNENGLSGSICDTFTNHVIADSVALNFGPDARVPRLRCDPIGSEHPATAEALSLLRKTNVIQGGAKLDAFARRTHGIPLEDAYSASDDMEAADAE
jgi:hypothetical protein